jgi:hypothetical protein
MRVAIDTNTERRLWALLRGVNTEIGGWGYARLDGGDLLWHEVFLIPQEVSDTEVDFEATGGDVAAIERATADGVLEDPSFVWVSWHSHHKMKSHWSKTDDARIAAMSTAGVRRLLSFVGSHDGTYRLRLDVFDVLAHGITLKQITLNDLTLERSSDDEFTKAIEGEIKANVKEIKAATGLGDWLGSSLSLMPPHDEMEFDVEETLAVRELTDLGYSHEEAVHAVGELGVHRVGDLIDHEAHKQTLQTSNGGKL